MPIIQDFGGSVQDYVAQFARIVFLRPSCCPHCGQADKLIGHGFYWRKAKDQTQVFRMRVKRWLCKACRRTLSVLPSFVLRFRHCLLAVIQAVVVTRYEDHASWQATTQRCATDGLPALRMLVPTREAVAMPEAALICQTTLLASLSLPAFLYDDFGDLVAANTGATGLVGLSRETLEADASWQDARYHTMRVVCDPALGYASRLGADWEQIALRQMLFFRRVSLKRRAELAMADRLRESLRLPQFRHLWDMVMDAGDWSERSLIEYAHAHPHTGQPLCYLGTPTVQPTPWGELVLGMFVPLNAETAAAVVDLVQENGVVALADWPK